MGRGFTSQRMMVLSALPEASVFPSGLKATLFTRIPHAIKALPDELDGNTTSQRVMEPSDLPEVSVFPSGLKATPAMPE